MRIQGSFTWLGIGIVGISLASCSGLTTVERVQQQPQRSWFNSTVKLEGTIVDQAPLIDAQLYQLQDDTGKIWVLTTDDNLQAGEQVVVRGEVQFESIPIGGSDFGEAYIQEQEREVIQPDDDR